MEIGDFFEKQTLNDVTLHIPFKPPQQGSLNISRTLIFSSRTKCNESYKENNPELWVNIENIDCVESRSTLTEEGGVIVIKCKDFRVLKFEIKNTNDLEKLSASFERFIDFINSDVREKSGYKVNLCKNNWVIFNPEDEFRDLLDSGEWRVSNVNANFTVCSSYPSTLIVPQMVSDEILIASSRFREDGRFPIVCYRHICGAVILRTSQPLCGQTNKRCKEDEQLLDNILGNVRRGYIIDTRTQAAAQNAKTRGGGFESDVYYPRWKRFYSNLPKYQVLLESLAKLIEACNDSAISVDKWLSKLDSSGWLEFVRKTLDTACSVAQLIVKKDSVCIHGSSGTNFTLAITSLAQILLNPDCRTVRGFEALIDREWIQGGYPFGIRHAHSVYSWLSTKTGSVYNPSLSSTKIFKNESPTFLLFLDCVQQLHYQYPCSFEFNTYFLLLLFENSYFSEYGTLLCNNQMERKKINLQENSKCLWNHLNNPEILKKIQNPAYTPRQDVIWPSVAPISLNVWDAVYLRWVMNPNPETEILEFTTSMKEQEIGCQKQFEEVQKEISNLNVCDNEEIEKERSPVFSHPLADIT